MIDVIVHVFGCTDVGRMRDHNEDAFLVADLADWQPIPLSNGVARRVIGDRGLVLMVADGMGGAAAGEVASGMAVDAVLDSLHTGWNGTAGGAPASMGQRLAAATNAANERIHRYASEHPQTQGMGTTATVAGVVRDTLAVVQVGDSRAYLVRNGQVQQLTKDQSLLQRLVDAGDLTAQQAEASSGRNIILQALGTEPSIAADLTTHTLRRGDVVVLCSDGLSTVVRRAEIGRIVEGAPDVATACQQLVAMANTRGGPDNITVVVAQFLGKGLAGELPRPVFSGPVLVPSRGAIALPGPITRFWRRLRGRDPR